MLTVAVISQKGGAGKTTLAIHLAAAAHAAGLPTVIVDTDPQATASRWGKWRGGKDPDVIDCASHALLPDKLMALERAGATFAVIDTPPAADIMAREACRAADLLLIPCRPRAFDLDAVRTTAELAKASGKPAFVVFMAGPPRGGVLYPEADCGSRRSCFRNGPPFITAWQRERLRSKSNQMGRLPRTFCDYGNG